MSTSRDAFEALILRDLRRDFSTQSDADFLGKLPDGRYKQFEFQYAWLSWQASRRAALEEAAKACEAEYLNEPQAGTEDIAYDYAVRDCAAAIRALASGTKEGQEPC